MTEVPLTEHVQGHVPDLIDLLGSADAAEGVRSFVERRDASFVGQ